MHSAYSDTEHRGRVMTSLHGLPASAGPLSGEDAPWTAAQSRRHDANLRSRRVLFIDPSRDPFDVGECPEGTMQHRAGQVHRVYADGRTVKTFPVVLDFNERGEQVDFGLQAANTVARAMRRTATDPVTVTVDAWCPERECSSAYDTLPDDRAIPSVYREALDALQN